MDGTWTITELAERAAEALAADGSVRLNGRVRDLPNERLIRWYTTIGLVDPPLGRRGRTALYGHRHLLQLLAVKRRQSAGRTIAQIQAELAGATDATLERIATPPPGEAEAAVAEPQTGGETPSAVLGRATRDAGAPESREHFWAGRTDVSYSPPAEIVGLHDSRPALVQGVRLTPDLTVLLDVPALSGDDLAAIESAARPLIEELRRRGLIAGPDEAQDTSPALPRRSP